MKRTIALFAFIFFIIPSLTFADQVTDLQTQLRTVLQRIEELRAQLVTPTTGSTASVTGGVISSCPTLTRTLVRGSTGTDVSSLQAFLMRDPSIYTSGVAGMYGPATERGVQLFQIKYGIVSGGSPSTTGFGVVGAKTRAAIAALCGGAGTGSGSSDGSAGGAGSQIVGFSFSGSGTAPFDARLSLQTLESLCVSYEIDWGDGSEKQTYDAPQAPNSTLGCGTGVTERILQHTYYQSGNYTAVLRAVKGARTSSMPEVVRRTISVRAGDPYVTVQAPTVGSSLRLGEYTKLKWVTGNFPDDSAIAFYLVGPAQTYSFAKRSMRSREFDWIVGDRVCDGNSCDVQMPVGQYKIRAVMYAPIDGCLDFCAADDVPARIITSSETGVFTVGNIGSSGNVPIKVGHTRGNAPLTTNVHVELQPTSTASNFELDFGDGTSKFTIAVPPGETRTVVRDIAHTYTKSGTFTVTLKPVGGVQNVGTAQVVIDAPTFAVIPKEGALAPTVAKATFQVDQSCSVTPNIVRRYTVDWGDATETSVYEYTPTLCANSSNPGPQTIVSQSFTHPYTDAGTKTIKLRTTAGSASFEATQTISIAASEYKLTPSFGFIPLTTTASYKVDQGCSVSGAATATYTIEWGDTTAASTYTASLPACGSSFTPNIIDKTVTHKYTLEGNYTTKLTIKRSDIATPWTKTRDLVADKTVAAYWQRMFSMAIEQANAQFASVAEAVYVTLSPTDYE